jgi:signal transduction histidine kinase
MNLDTASDYRHPAIAWSLMMPRFLTLLTLLLFQTQGAADTLGPVPLAFSTLPVTVQSWAEAASRYRAGDLPPAQTDIHLGHQPGPRYFAASPPWPAAPQSEPGRAPILTLTTPNLDVVDLVYLAPDGSLAAPRPRTGDTIPLAERDLVAATLAFRLDPGLLRDHALLLRVTSVGQVSLVPRLMDAAGFAIEQAQGFLIGGMLAGLAGLFALLMLAAWASTRDPRLLAFVLLSVPFSLTGLAVMGQLPYFLPSVPSWILGRAASPLSYVVTACLIFSYYLIVRPPTARTKVRGLWFVLAWLMLALAPIGFTSLHPHVGRLVTGVQLAFIAFVLAIGPWHWRGTSPLGRTALVYLFATCASGVPVVARTWFPGLASLAVAHFWQLNLLFQSFTLIAVLTVSGRALRAIPEQALRLERSQRERSRLTTLAQEFGGLLRVASHEIRNPASSLRLIAGNLRRGTVTTEEAAVDLTHLSDHLADIVAGLHAQRAAFGTGIAAGFRYDLRGKVEQVMAALGGNLDRARLDLRVAAGEGTDTHLIDAPRLTLILTNLLDNAFKYGGTGVVRVHLASAPRRFSLLVSDQGPGLSADEQTHLFTQFWRGARTHHITGWGLGLWACRTAVEALGGSIHYLPQAPAGAGFQVTLEHASAAERNDTRGPP